MKIIYASLTGNTEVIVKKIQEILKGKNIDAELIEADMARAEIINDDEKFIIATSTWDNGNLNSLFEAFYEEMEMIDMSGKKFGFIGLGDKIYGDDVFCKAIDTIKDRVVSKGGVVVGDVMKIDGDPSSVEDDVLMGWVDQFLKGEG